MDKYILVLKQNSTVIEISGLNVINLPIPSLQINPACLQENSAENRFACIYLPAVLTITVPPISFYWQHHTLIKTVNTNNNLQMECKAWVVEFRRHSNL